MNALKSLGLIVIGAIIGAGVLYIVKKEEITFKIKQNKGQQNNISEDKGNTNIVVHEHNPPRLEENKDTPTDTMDEPKVDEENNNENGAPKLEVATADWFKDPMCRIIFFATLEGLYNDGISTEVVDLIIGKNSALDNKVKHNFIFRCDLCHAVYEAFVLYQRRQIFYGSEENTFGNKVINERTIKDLQNSSPSSRVFAMGRIVQPWIKDKLRSMNLGEEDKKAIMEKFISLAEKGAELTLKYRNEDPDYFDWRFYGTCQACDAIKTVSEEMQRQK